jgi:prevent-host-death family protein
MKVTVHQAKTQLSRILRQVASGEEVVIVNRKKPVAKLVAYSAKTVLDLKGDLKGKVRLAKDFDRIPEGFEDYS